MYKMIKVKKDTPIWSKENILYMNSKQNVILDLRSGFNTNFIVNIQYPLKVRDRDGNSRFAKTATFKNLF